MLIGARTFQFLDIDMCIKIQVAEEVFVEKVLFPSQLGCFEVGMLSCI